jgi:serine/threonine protein phosphatase 1
MNYIIGDLHANIEQLDKLLAIIDPQKGDTLIFLGDLIDKGRSPRELIDRLWEIKTKYQTVFIKGDHEFVWERYLKFGELGRQDFLLRYGGVETVAEYDVSARHLLESNATDKIKKYLGAYLDLIDTAVDYHIVSDFLALHAGLRAEQMNQSPLVFEESNYFLREQDADLDHRYLGKYLLVAGHTHFGDEPLLKPGYLNIDSGAGYGKYISAFMVERATVIRSDGRTFPLAQKIIKDKNL